MVFYWLANRIVDEKGDLSSREFRPLENQMTPFQSVPGWKGWNGFISGTGTVAGLRFVSFQAPEQLPDLDSSHFRHRNSCRTSIGSISDAGTVAGARFVPFRTPEQLPGFYSFHLILQNCCLPSFGRFAANQPQRSGSTACRETFRAKNPGKSSHSRHNRGSTRRISAGAFP
jgi:hypothetical protein